MFVLIIKINFHVIMEVLMEYVLGMVINVWRF